jgi:hypothetical protein
MQYIKLVRDDYTTKNGYKYEIGKRHRATGERGQGLCSDEYLHCYESLEQAAVMAPAHVGDDYTKALLVEGRAAESDGTKVGLRQLMVIREVEPLELSTEQRVAIAIVCVSRVCADPGWTQWAANLLSGRDRSHSAAAWEAAWAAARARWVARDTWAAWVTRPSTRAAWAAWVAAWAAREGVDITAIVRLVLDTPEEQWEKLLDD